MEALLVLKRDLTAPLPLAGVKKGTVTKHVGKGAVQQRTPPGMRETVTGPANLPRAMGAYPKAAPAPAPAAPAGPPIGPMGPMGPGIAG